MSKSLFNAAGFAVSNCEVMLHHFNEFTKEYAYSGRESVIVGTSIPANSTMDEPLKKKEGFAIVMTDKGWDYVEDHRNQSYFAKANGEHRTIVTLGSIGDELTDKEPPSADHYWNGSDWEIDTMVLTARARASASQERAIRLAATTAEITPLQYAIQDGYATPEDQKKYKDLRKLVYLLSKVDVSNPENIVWPELGD